MVLSIASVIYLCLLLPACYSGLPSGSGEQPSNTGIHDLATPGTHSSGCHHPDWWALTPPSHPYLANEAVVFFYVNPAVTDTLHINKRDALCCPDFPHTPQGSKRQTVQLLSRYKISARRAKKQTCLHFSEPQPNLKLWSRLKLVQAFSAVLLYFD